MPEDCGNKRSAASCALQSVTGVLLIVPCGFLVGTLFALIKDFGLGYTVDNIRLNPDMFADQYARPLVSAGWVALACLTLVAMIVGAQWWMGRRR